VKFSIVTPSFNQGRFIRDCIESVCTQQGVDWEHIIFDACSTDETVGILKSYLHLQWVSEPDKGQTDAINKGFLKATGDWVMWLNADDYLLPGALQKAASFAEAHPAAEVIYGKWQLVDASKNLIRIMNSLPFDLLMMVHSTPYIGSTACFFNRRAIVEEGLLLCDDLHYVMDTEYYVRLGKAGKKFRYVPAVLAAFRVHGGNASLRNRQPTSFHESLKLQKQYAESMAIHRTYGITWFTSPVANNLMDSILFYLYGSKKVLTRFLYNALVSKD
jgi:glycosyltransferase involved in cell wall biosynthesis